MPGARAHLPYDRALECEEIEALRWGHVPREPGESWHAFMEDDRLYLRDTTHEYLDYQVLFERDGDAWRVAEAWGSREFDDADRTLERDVKFLDNQVDWLIEHNATLAGPATRESWKNQPMPQECALLKYERYFTEPEQEALARGLIPETMEDRWFVFIEDSWLHLCRSWTGYCIFMVRLAPEDEGWRVAEAWVNEDRDEFKGASPEDLTRTLDAVIDWMIDAA